MSLLDTSSHLNLGITNIYIEKVLKLKCNNFIGVFSPDTLPYPNKNMYGSIVCNLSNSDKLGSHFIFILIKDQLILYIDPFGVPCSIDKINVFLNRLSSGRKIHFNSTMIQDISSSYCGFFCILFAIYFDKQRSHHLKFYINPKMNDSLCLKYIKQFS